MASGQPLPATGAAEINAVLTECKVELQPNGSPTEDTQLKRWPRFAPPPKRMQICCWQQQPAGSPHPLVAFLGSCMQQELSVRLLREVEKLELFVGH
jgi:hypothetical protein